MAGIWTANQIRMVTPLPLVPNPVLCSIPGAQPTRLPTAFASSFSFVYPMDSGYPSQYICVPIGLRVGTSFPLPSTFAPASVLLWHTQEGLGLCARDTRWGVGGWGGVFAGIRVRGF